MKYSQSKVQIPYLGIQGPKIDPNYIISTVIIQRTLCSNRTRHLTASQYPYQTLILFSFQAYHSIWNTVLILPTPLSPVKITLIFKVHHKWSGLLGAFLKQQANFNIFSPTLFSPEFCLNIYFITYQTMSSVNRIVSIDAKYWIARTEFSA